MAEWQERCATCGVEIRPLSDVWVAAEDGNSHCVIADHIFVAPRHVPALPDLTDVDDVEAWLDA